MTQRSCPPPKKLVAFSWYGSKCRLVSRILPLLPNDAACYVEPFGGSAVVLLSRPPAPIEYYNDLDSDLVNFYRVLRDRPDDLIRALLLTPYSRGEYLHAWSRLDPSLSPRASQLERARRLYVRCVQAFCHGVAGGKTPGWHSSGRVDRPKFSSRSNWNAMLRLPDVYERLRFVHLGNRPAARVIALYDHPDTLIYCDPPYPGYGRESYVHAMSAADHRSLAAQLHACKARVAISGFRSSSTASTKSTSSDHLMSFLYSDWLRIDFPARQIPSSNSGKGKLGRESLWTNYTPRTGRRIASAESREP